MTQPAGSIYYEGNQSHVGIVLCHAYTGSPLDVKALANVLHARGYAVLCPLFSGHGTQDIRDILAVSPQEWWADLHAAIMWMQSRHSRLMIFGLSMGGVMAMKALTTHNNAIIAGGVFNSPVVNRASLQLEERFMWYAEFLAKKRGEQDLFKQEANKILTLHHQQVQAIQDFALSFAPALASISVPVYVAQSGQDELIDPEAVYDLLDCLEQAKVDFHWFAENTHVITVNPNRGDFEASLQRFIEQNQG